MYEYSIDANYIGAVVHSGSTDWTDFSSSDFYDQTSPDGGGSLDLLPAGLALSWIQIDATDAASAINVKLSPRDGAGDDPSVTLRVPAGSVFTRGLRGLVPDGVSTISVKLNGGDTIYISANLDRRG